MNFSISSLYPATMTTSRSRLSSIAVSSVATASPPKSCPSPGRRQAVGLVDEQHAVHRLCDHG